MVHTYVLHLLNGTTGVDGAPVFYNGDCERMCAAADIDVFDARAGGRISTGA